MICNSFVKSCIIYKLILAIALILSISCMCAGWVWVGPHVAIPMQTERNTPLSTFSHQDAIPNFPMNRFSSHHPSREGHPSRCNDPPSPKVLGWQCSHTQDEKGKRWKTQAVDIITEVALRSPCCQSRHSMAVEHLIWRTCAFMMNYTTSLQTGWCKTDRKNYRWRELKRRVEGRGGRGGGRGRQYRSDMMKPRGFGDERNVSN